MILSSIYIYPVKSLGGIKLLSSGVEERGLKYDRRWMITDRNNRFVTQRTHPRLSLINVIKDGNEFILEDRGSKSEMCSLPLELNSGFKKQVVVWDDTTGAYFSDEQSSRWISAILQGEYKFVYMPDTERRTVENNSDKIVSFADAYPFLIIGENSLNDLNNRLPEKIEMIRFRPNFVFTGGEPYEEDYWKDFSIGEVKFSAVKPCARCTIPTINPMTGGRSAEPTRTLSDFRKWNNKVYFGMNLICLEQSGRVAVGDQITVAERSKILWENKNNE